MMNGRRLVSAVVALSVSAIAAAACQSAPVPPGEEPGSEALQHGPSRYFCGGFAGIQCPPGYVCEDDPNDDCDPEAGGADCGGICVGVPSQCFDPDRLYVSYDPDECAAILFLCIEGYLPFFDECGCGCEPAPPTPPTPTLCGENECARGEYCCNPSCGICAPIGGSCILVACE